MILFALDPFWNDFYTAGGFYVGVLGTVVGIAGFWIAIVQIKKTQRAVEAARDAANKTLAESKRSYSRFVADYASRLLENLRQAVNDEDWQLADRRAHEIAEILGTLRLSSPVATLRDFGRVFGEKVAERRVRFERDKWNALLATLFARLDRLRAPFLEDEPDDETLDAPRQEAPTDRGGTRGEDQDGTGPVGPDGGPPAGDQLPSGPAGS